MVLALGYNTMQEMFLVALWMERNIQEKWSEDICFRVIVLKNVVDWMLFLSFSYWFVSDKGCLVYVNSCADWTVFYECSKEVPRSLKLKIISKSHIAVTLF
jgi:hypothetical protein